MIRGWEGLPDFSKQMFTERYLNENETYDEWVGSIAYKYSDNTSMTERIESYIKNYWFMPSTPISSRADLPISCYTNSVTDTKEDIFKIWQENNEMGSLGGGIGTSWSNVRAIGEKVAGKGKSSGIIPFVKVSDSSVLAVKQGGLRRASQAVYLDVSHPEIDEFVDVRRPTGDKDRRSTNIHHGIIIPDTFMHAVEDGTTWDLISPKTKKVIHTVDAKTLWRKILISRIETGEPYIMFSDNVNRQLPIEYKEIGAKVQTSNLCAEILLRTSEELSGVCCLTSTNLEFWDEYKDNEQFFLDIHTFTDNVLQEFIDKTENAEGLSKARRSAIEERSIGIGVMGFHSYLQSKDLPFGSISSNYIHNNIMNKIQAQFKRTNLLLGESKGTCLISKDKRNTHVTAIAPTASISTLCNLTSQGIDPRIANAYIAKNNMGTFLIRNKFLEKKLEKYEEYDEKLFWKSVLKHNGSIQHIDFISNADKEIFLTAFEIDNRWIVDYAGERAKYVDQGSSTNMFLYPNINKKTLSDLHVKAWKNGTKTLYYVRSIAMNRANVQLVERECLSCS